MDGRFSILKSGWATLPTEKTRSAKKAMDKYRLLHPVCEITGSGKRCQVHHIIPVWKAPELADDMTNMITLSSCANIHHIFGHAGNFQKRYVSNVKEIADKILDLKRSSDIVHRNEEEYQTKSKVFKVFFKRLIYKILDI